MESRASDCVTMIEDIKKVITICRMFIEPCELRCSFIELLHSRKF